MLGRLVLLGIAGLVAWKYRDPIREYMSGNAGPAREKMDGLLGTMQQRSESLLDQAKEELSARFESARQRIRAGAPEEGGGRPTE
jgi:hypothetical protein